MITLVNEVDAIAALNREIQLSSGITQTFADKQMKTMYASMQRLQNSTEAASLSLRDSLVPTVNFLANALQKSVKGIEDFGNALKTLVDILKPFKPIISGLLSILLTLGPLILAVGVGAKLLAYVLPMVGASAIVTATGVTSLGLAIKQLFAGLFLIMIPLQTISMIFPQLSGSISTLTTVLFALLVAWKFHLLSVLASTAALIAHSIVAGFYHIKLTLITGLLYLQIAAYAIWNSLVTVATGVLMALTVATGSFAAALAIATAGISLLIGAIAWLATNFGTVTDAISNFVGGITDSLGITNKQVDLTKEEVKQLSDLETAINDVTVAEQKRLKAQQDVNKMMAQGITDINAYTEAMNELGNANAEYNEKSTKVLEISADFIGSVRSYSENLDKAISSTGSYNTLIREKGTLESSNARLSESQTQLIQEYNQAISEGGVNSDKAAQIYEQYIKISGDIVSNDRRMLTLKEEIKDANKELTDNTSKLNTEEKERLQIVNQVIDVQEELLNTYDKIADIQARIFRLESINRNLIKLLTEQNKRLWEGKLKLLDAEEKLAKLRASEPRLLDDIFNALAEQGLLTQEIIDLYVRLQEAQGNLIESRIAYFGIMSDLSSEERALVNDAIEKYKELRSAGMSADEAFQQAFGGLIDLIPSLDLSELAVIGDYAEDLWLVGDATKALGDVFKDLIPVLQNLGLEELIDALYEWMRLMGEIALAEENVEEATYDVNEALRGTVDILSSEWLVVGRKTVDGNWDVFESFKALSGLLPSLSSAVTVFDGNMEMLVGQLLSSVNATNLAEDSFDKYSASTLIVISSLIEMYEQQGYTINKTTTLDDIIKVLGMDSKTAYGMLVNGANSVVSPNNKAADSLSELKNVLGDKDSGLIGGISDVVDELRILIAELQKDPPKNFFQGIQEWIAGLVVGFGQFLGILPKNKGSTNTNTGNGTGGSTSPTQHSVARHESNPLTGMTRVISDSGASRFFPNAIARATYPIGKIIPWEKGGFTKGPQLSMIGEKGPEAVIPLHGINKKYGRDLLEYIIPRYYPDLMKMQTGGVVGGSYDYSTANNENFNVTGPIVIQGVQDPTSFSEALKFRMRSSK